MLVAVTIFSLSPIPNYFYGSATSGMWAPELQPAERLWSLVDEPIVNQAPHSLECLEEIIAQRCCVLTHIPLVEKPKK